MATATATALVVAVAVRWLMARGSWLWLVAMCHTLPAMTRSMTRRGFLSAPMNEAGSYNIGRGRWQEVRVGAWSTWLVVAGFSFNILW